MIHILKDGTLLSFYLHLLLGSDNKVLTVNRLQDTLYLFPIGAKHFHLLTDEVDILLGNLERLAETRRTHFQFKVLFVAVEMFLNETAQCHAVINPHAIDMVYLHHDPIIRTDLYIDKEIVLVLQPFFYKIFNNVLVYHIMFFKIK